MRFDDTEQELSRWKCGLHFWQQHCPFGALPYPLQICWLYYSSKQKNFYRDSRIYIFEVIIDEGSRPQFLHKDIVTKWKEYWATPEFQVKSQQASKNRRSEPAGPGTGLSIHYGGSRSAISHAEHVAREKNISIADAHYDTFMRMHFKKGQFDGRAQTQGLEIHSRVEELRSTLGRDVTPDEVSQIYREVVTPDPKGRRLGLGIMSQMRSTGSTSTHSTCSSQFPSAAVSAQIAQLQTELEQTQQREATLQATLQAEVQERRRKEAEMEAEVQERRRKEAEMETRQLEMQQQISQLMKFFQSSSGSFPRSSSPP
ncbi:uncharacterized protein LOC130990032 [Salvia miltiorrhiza]|uniref:uncharacterized protein LOC130990032 n=1 Tax=Salvia miltiorrhiza TaxID=226208 RepID=UPI0025AC619B|nr:uncharacterized protein LOC130990032 [Salvia miltiorrhiza]